MYRPNAGQIGVFGQNNIFQSLGSADEFQLELAICSLPVSMYYLPYLRILKSLLS